MGDGGRQIVHAAVEVEELRVILLRDAHAQFLVKSEHEVEEVHRVDVELLTQWHDGVERRGVHLRGDPTENGQYGLSNLVAGHSFPGSCSRRSTAARNSPPRWPSLARWSAERVVVTTGRTTTCPPVT